MGNVDGPQLTYAILAVVLVGSSLLSRRIPLGQFARMAAAWVGIFGLAFLIFAFRSELSAPFQRVKAELFGTPLEQGGEIRIPIASDGHFYTDVKVNGHSVRFMIDTGATTTTISSSDAYASDVPPGNAKVLISTANGTATATVSEVGKLQLGSIERRDFQVMINENDNVNLIGMNFLSTLSSWRVEGHDLVLKP